MFDVILIGFYVIGNSKIIKVRVMIVFKKYLFELYVNN